MHHRMNADGCHLFPYDLIYEDLLNLCHHVADENHSTHDEEHDHREQVFQESTHDEEHDHHVQDALVSTHVLVHDHHELVFLESTLCEVLCHHDVEHGHRAEVFQESTLCVVHDRLLQDALLSTLFEVLCHHEQVFQESTLYEVILNLNLHEKRFLRYERYGQQMILLNQMESIQDESQHCVLDDRYAVHGLDESL